MSEIKHGSYPAQPEKGAWLLREPKGTPDIILFSNANNVTVLYAIADVLAVQGYTARIAIMANKERFCAQDESYRRTLFSKDIPARLGLYQNALEKAMYEPLTTHLMPSDSSKTLLVEEALAALRG